MVAVTKIQPWCYLTDGKRLLEVVEIRTGGVVKLVDCSEPCGTEESFGMGINAVARFEVVRDAPEIPDAA
jgi:hypothetical protein